MIWINRKDDQECGVGLICFNHLFYANCCSLYTALYYVFSFAANFIATITITITTFTAIFAIAYAAAQLLLLSYS